MADIQGSATQIHGTRSNDAVDGDNPVKLGMKAVAVKANPTDVAAADRTDWLALRNGIPLVLGGHMNAITRTARTTAVQTDATIVPSIAAGTAVVVTRVTALCDKANSVDVRVKVGFGTSTLPSDATGGTDGFLVDHPGVPAGGGFTIGDGTGILGIGASNEEVRYTVEVPTSGAVTVSVTYFTISI